MQLSDLQRVTEMGDVSRIKLAYGPPVEDELSPDDLEDPSRAAHFLAVEGDEGGVGVVEACESDSDGEEGGEEEVVYPAEGKTVDEDAELFQVTTPVKVTLPEPLPDSSEVRTPTQGTHANKCNVAAVTSQLILSVSLLLCVYVARLWNALDLERRLVLPSNAWSSVYMHQGCSTQLCCLLSCRHFTK